jgi:hypothetical protein
MSGIVERRKRTTVVRETHVSNGLYGLGFIGALIYFIQTATSFGDGAIGLLKAIVWPAILIYEALKFLGA